jgi:hypothetical protein
MEKSTPQAPEAAEGAPEPMEEVAEEAAAATGGEEATVPPEVALEVAIRSPEIQDARQVLELEYKELAFECEKHMELRIASDRDLVNCYKSLQKLNEDCEVLRAQLKDLEEAALPIARLLVPHLGGPKIAPLADRLREAPSRLAAYVNHMARSIPKQILAFMKSYFPKAPVEVVAGGVAANCTDEQYAKLLEQMAPIAEQVADKLNLQ